MSNARCKGTLTGAVAELSSGPIYYHQPQDWYEELKITLARFNCIPGEMPQVHTDSGQDYIRYTGHHQGEVYFTWFKMPSGNWEIICYVCHIE